MCCPAQVLCKKVSDSYLWSLVTFLLEGLVDYQAHSSSGACVVLNNVVKLRGSVLSEQVPCSCVHVCNIVEVSDVWVLLCTHMLMQVPDLIDGLHARLEGISTPQTRTGSLRCMRTICHQYLVPTLTHLLNKPLPWDG